MQSTHGTTLLKADGDILGLAAQNTYEQHSTNSGSSGSVGIALTVGGAQNGLSFNASASRNRGSADGTDLTWTNSHISGQKVVIETEGNATLTGAVIAGQQVSGYVRGNLTIESLQDTSTYDSQQKSAGAGVSVCVPPFCVGTSSGSVSFSNARANGQYASVTEQSGIQAGDGGYQLTVDGNTHLKGGVISSSAKASEDGKNSLVTGTLSRENLFNVDSYEASGVSVSLGAGGLGGNSPGLSATPGYSHSSGHQQSQTISSISAGTLVVTNDQAQRNLTGQSAQEAVASIDRSAVTGTDLSNALNKNWDGRELQAKTQAELLITRTALPLISNEIAGQMNQQALDLRNQAQQLPDSDPAKQQLLAEAARYDEGGAYRIAAHTVLGGLGGGLSGAAGAGAAAAAAPSLNELQSAVQQQLLDTGTSQTTASLVSRLVSGATATAISSGAGSAAGGSVAGALTGANADFNNRQLALPERQVITDLARKKAAEVCRGDQSCVASQTLFWTDTLEAVALSLVDEDAAKKRQSYMEQLSQAALNPRSVAATGALQNYLDATQAAMDMLAPYVGQPLAIGNRPLMADGAPQTYFSASEAQFKDPYANTLLGQSPSSVAPLKNVRDDERLEHFNVINGSAVPDTTIEELLVGNRVINRGISAIGRAIAGYYDVEAAGFTAATEKGFLNGAKTALEGAPAKLNAQELTQLARLGEKSLVEQAVIREDVVDNYFLRNGYVKLNGKCGSNNCFDGVYIRGNTVVINEVKPSLPSGAIQLSGNSDSDIGAQMSKQWIEGAVDRLKDSPSQSNQLAATIIRNAIDNGNLTTTITGVNSSGINLIRIIPNKK